MKLRLKFSLKLSLKSHGQSIQSRSGISNQNSWIQIQAEFISANQPMHEDSQSNQENNHIFSKHNQNKAEIQLARSKRSTLMRAIDLIPDPYIVIGSAAFKSRDCSGIDLKFIA